MLINDSPAISIPLILLKQENYLRYTQLLKKQWLSHSPSPNFSFWACNKNIKVVPEVTKKIQLSYLLSKQCFIPSFLHLQIVFRKHILNFPDINLISPSEV